MSDVEEISELTPLDVANTITHIRNHLAAASELAIKIGRDDWAKRIDTLYHRIGGRGPSRSLPAPLAPVGPPMDILAWVEECISSLTTFREQYMVAHGEDPDNFPRERPRSEWFEEWGSRPQLMNPAADPDHEDE